jgi:hypothetical protein
LVVPLFSIIKTWADKFPGSDVGKINYNNGSSLLGMVR